MIQKVFTHPAMHWNPKICLNFISISLLTLIAFFPVRVSGQVIIKGRVINQKDATPAAAANITLLHEQQATFSNKDGQFSLSIKNIKSNDTLLITSVGYESLRIPVSAALLKKEFVLKEQVKNLESVTVFNTAVLGSTVETVGYFRSWNPKHTGGEIGRTFKLPYKKYKIDKVRFKVANFCDTCLLRLHIREVDHEGKPGDEILKDSISININKMMLNGKIPEFDISEYDLTFREDELFVSIEVLNCSTRPKETCSFSFAGTEKGAYIYKSTGNGEWQITDDYTLYLKLFLRY